MTKTNFRIGWDTCIYFILHTYRPIRGIYGKSVTGNIEIEFVHSQTAQTVLLVLTVDTLHVLYVTYLWTSSWTGVKGCKVIENRFLGFSDIDIYNIPVCVCVCQLARVRGKVASKTNFADRKKNCESNIKYIYILKYNIYTKKILV